MTTYKEMNTSKRVNRKFWNARVKFLISMLKEHQRLNCEKSKAFIKSYQCDIEQALENRRCFKYLED